MFLFDIVIGSHYIWEILLGLGIKGEKSCIEDFKTLNFFIKFKIYYYL